MHLLLVCNVVLSAGGNRVTRSGKFCYFDLKGYRYHRCSNECHSIAGYAGVVSHVSGYELDSLLKTLLLRSNAEQPQNRCSCTLIFVLLKG